MGNRSLVIIGPNVGNPGAPTAEAAAAEYFHNRVTFGDWAPKPLISRWRPDQRAKFEAELERLEAERSRQKAEAAEFATRGR